MDLWQASKLSFDICLKRNYLIDSGGGTRGQYQDLRDYSSSSLKREMTSENAEARRVEELAEKKRSGELSGEDLKRMYEEGNISKAERRQVIKLASKPALKKSARQILRDEVRKKKQQPREKLSAEQRKEKYSDGDQVNHEREKNAANFVVCLGCRKRGHFLKDCPKLAGGPMFDAPQQGQLVCFNCGSNEHALRACEKPRRQDGYLPFASCFLCKEKRTLLGTVQTTLTEYMPKADVAMFVAPRIISQEIALKDRRKIKRSGSANRKSSDRGKRTGSWDRVSLVFLRRKKKEQEATLSGMITRGMRWIAMTTK